jgi:hypothetical protein
MSVQPKELMRVAEKVLAIMNVTEASKLQLTYALRTEGKWKVSFAYELPHFVGSGVKKIGSYMLDEQTEDIEGMWLDRCWK